MVGTDEVFSLFSPDLTSLFLAGGLGGLEPFTGEANRFETESGTVDRFELTSGGGNRLEPDLEPGGGGGGAKAGLEMRFPTNLGFDKLLPLAFKELLCPNPPLPKELSELGIE